MKKKILGLVIFLIGIGASFAMDVAPLYFVDAQGNPIAANLQQEYWNYLVKYKLFGNDFVKTGNRVIIHDESGWTGSNGYFSAEQPDGQGASVGTQLGGPIVVAGKITTGDGYKFTTGPIRGGSFQSGQNCNNCYYAAPICLDNTNVTGGGTAGFQAQPISNCPDQPSPNTAVSIPLLEWPASPTVADIKISANNGEQRIFVPDPVDGSKAPYDMYMDSILTGIGGTDGAKITVSMPAGGRVTRIFVHQIQLGNHTVIQIVYRTPQEDGSVVEVPAEKYVGNLLFYTDHDINIKNTDNSILLGTYVSTGRIFLQSNINFAGQLIAKELVVGNEFDGRSFVFVPIDPPVLDLKPQADTPLEFPENDLLVKVPIALDTPAPADVFIDYCFDLQNSSAGSTDFFLDTIDGRIYSHSTDGKKYLFPICGQNMGKVTILEDAKTPADAPDVSVWINVAKDELVERPNETLRLKITNISGAVLPGNKLDGYFDLIIVDANIEPTSENFEITATEDEVFTFDSSMFKYESAFDKVEQGVVIMSLPEKGFLLSNGDTLTSSDLNKFIPINETTNIDLQFIAAKDEYGVSPAYTSFTFKMKDADNVVSEKPYTVTVKVNPVNDKPIAHDTVYTINENVAAGTAAAGKIRMEDVDDTQFTYAFDTNDPKYTTVDNLFEINSTTGEITVKNAGLDYEGLNADTTMVIKVIVTDVASTSTPEGAGKLADTSNVTIKVVDVNEAPVVRDTAFTVDENVPAGTEVGTLEASDPDIRNSDFGTLYFSIDENADGNPATNVPFAIDNDGKITVTADDALDFETKPTWVIHVTVTDGFIPQTVEVVINLNDLNEEPVIVNLQGQYNEFEHVENGHIFATVKVVDQDGSDGASTISAQIIDNNAGTPGVVTADQLFDVAVVEGTGDTLLLKFFVKDSALLDYEKLFKADTVLYEVTLSITDANGGDDSKTITAPTKIYVTDVNETPTAEDGEFTIKENSVAGTYVGTVDASDPDVVNPGYGTLYYSLMTETPQFEIDELTGKITVAAGAELDYETTPDHQITLMVAVTDRVIAEPLMVTVVVHLTDENEKPILTCKPDDMGCRGPFDAIENSAKDSVIYEFVVFDVDAGDRGVLETFIVDSLHRGADTLFTTRFNDDSTLVQLIVKKGTNLNYEKLDETYLIVITVKDDDGLNDTLIREVNIVDVNEAPVVADADFNVKENSTSPAFVGQVVADDEDKWAVLHYTLENIPGEGDVASLFDIDDEGNITVAANAVLDYETRNEYRLKVVVTDNGSDKGFEDMSDDAIVVIHVTDEDEKPGFDDKNPIFYVYENSKAGTDVGVVTATDDDCKDNTCATLTYKLIADENSAYANDYKEFQINPTTGKITVANDSTLNYETKDVYKVRVVVYDGAVGAAGTLTDTAFVTINIKDANDRPEIASKTLEVPENSTKNTLVGTVPATDEDTWSVLTYRLSDVDPADEVAKLFKIDNDGNIFVAEDYTLDHETRDQYKIWVVVTDNGDSLGFEKLSDSALVTINVTDVNEPPEFIDDGKPGYTVAENTVANTEVARYEIKDVDAADANFGSSLTVSIKDNNGQHTILAESLFQFNVETTSAGTFAVIRVKKSPDFEALQDKNQDTSFTVTLTLKDIAGDSATLEKKIYVSDVNEKPDVEDAEFAVKENSKKGDSVGVVAASDPDKYNLDFGTLYYSLLDATAGSTPGADTLFSIDNKGKITVAENAILNYEVDSVYYVKVRVTDKELSDTALVKVTLKDVEENPKIIVDDDGDGDDDTDTLCIAHCDTSGRGLDSITHEILTVGIDENSATGTSVFAYVVSDEDAGDVESLTASLRDDNGTGAAVLFTADVKKVDDKWKLVVSVLDGSKLDYETVDSLHQVTVYVTDLSGRQDSLVRIIKVRDVNEKPDVKDAEFTVTENSKKGDSVGVVVATDPDVINPNFGTLYYSLLDSTAGAASKFEINNKGKITVAENANLNYEADSVFYVKVRVTDNTLSDTATVKITLKNENEHPKIIVDDDGDGDDDTDTLCIAHCDTTGRGHDPITKKTLTVGVEENSPTNTVVFSYVVADEDFGDITNLVPTLRDDENSGTDSLFKIEMKQDGTKWKVVVSVADGEKLDYETIDPIHEVTVIVTDPNGLQDSIKRIIEVIDINEPPTFESWPFEFTEHNEPGTVVGHVEHGEDVDTMAISGISKPENYIHDKFELTGGADGADTLFTLLPNGDLVANKTFNFETDPTEYTIYISLMDTLMPELVETDTIHITLLDLNEKPWIVTDSVVVDEHVEKGTVIDTIEAKDLDLYDTVLTFTLVEDKSGCFDVSESGVVTVKTDNCKDLDYEENHELPIKVKVTDTVGDSETKTIIVKINDVNEKPDIPDQTITVSEDAEVGTEVGKIEATDPDTAKAYSTLTYELVEESEVFEVKEDGTVVLKDSLDYEKDSVYTIKVRVSDGFLDDTALVTINIRNVVETPDVNITRAETKDTSWTNPDTLYINTSDICIDWMAKNRKSGTVLKDTTECMELEEGENVIIKKFDDPTMDFPGADTLVVYVSRATPIVTVRKVVDDADSPNIFTVVEQSEKSDSSFYVNERKNDIVVTVKDPVTGSTEKFTTRVELDTVSVPSKTFTKTMAEIVDFGLALSDNPTSVSRTPVNGEKIAITYTEEVNGQEVKVTYYTDNKGELIENADGVVEITVSYTKEIDGHEVTISYQADAVTGAVIKTSGGYVRPEESAIESSSSGKGGSSSSSKKGGDSKKVENEVVFTVSYETVDEAGNIMTVSYGVDAEGNIVRNEDGNIGYQLTYNYTNKFGNSATQSLFIVLDQVPPAVKILAPADGEVVYSNYVDVKWTVDIGDGRGPIVQDTLITQGLKKGGNAIVRFYRDKAGNEASDTIRVIMKNAKDVDIAVEHPVTEISKDKVADYYAANEPEEDETFAVSIYNPKTNKEIETIVGGKFDNKKGSEDEPYPGLPGHLGPTIAIETKVPAINAVGGLATLDDIMNSDGLVLLDGVDADNSDKMPVEEYVEKYCTTAFAEKVGSDLSRVNLYKTKMYVKIWIYTTLGSFVDYYSFTQDLDNPDYVSDAALLTLYFEMKPDRDGNLRTESGRLMATGAYLYKTEVEMKSELQCTIPPVKDESAQSSKKGAIRTVKEDMLKSFGYKRPEIK